MMYTTFAVLFIAQAYHLALLNKSWFCWLLWWQVSWCFKSFYCRNFCNTNHVPEAGILLLLGIDQFLDMGQQM